MPARSVVETSYPADLDVSVDANGKVSSWSAVKLLSPACRPQSVRGPLYIYVGLGG